MVEIYRRSTSSCRSTSGIATSSSTAFTARSRWLYAVADVRICDYCIDASFIASIVDLWIIIHSGGSIDLLLKCFVLDARYGMFYQWLVGGGDAHPIWI